MLKELQNKKIILFCGTGGVGKTSLSASFAIEQTLQGKKVALLTIDPSKRLIQALGLKSLSNRPKNITKNLEQELKRKAKGELFALLFTAEHCLEKLIIQEGGEELLEELKANPLFQILMSRLSGLHDFFVLEKLYELYFSKKYDLILIDTPPARHTLDFLDAPRRLASFFNDRIFQWFLPEAYSKSWGERLRAQGVKKAIQTLEKVGGKGILHDFMDMSPHLLKLKQAFIDHQETALEVLQSEDSAVAFVCSPQTNMEAELMPFLKSCQKQKLDCLAFYLNRSLMHLCEANDDIDKTTNKAALAVYKNIEFLGKQEQKQIKKIKKLRVNSAASIIQVPEISFNKNALNDLYDLYLQQKIIQ